MQGVFEQDHGSSMGYITLKSKSTQKYVVIDNNGVVSSSVSVCIRSWYPQEIGKGILSVVPPGKGGGGILSVVLVLQERGKGDTVRGTPRRGGRGILSVVLPGEGEGGYCPWYSQERGKGDTVRGTPRRGRRGILSVVHPGEGEGGYCPWYTQERGKGNTVRGTPRRGGRVILSVVLPGEGEERYCPLYSPERGRGDAVRGTPRRGGRGMLSVVLPGEGKKGYSPSYPQERGKGDTCLYCDGGGGCHPSLQFRPDPSSNPTKRFSIPYLKRSSWTKCQTCFRNIRAKKNCYRSSFLPRSIPQWNNLPDQARSAALVDSFKIFLTSNVKFQRLLPISHYYDYCP